jgi:hypothetical protein
MIAAIASRELAQTVSSNRAQRIMRQHELLQRFPQHRPAASAGVFCVTRPDEL